MHQSWRAKKARGPFKKKPYEPVFREGLTPFELDFIDEYLLDRDALAAERRAKEHQPLLRRKMSAREALQNPLVVETVQRRLDQAAARADLSVDWILTRLKRIADADIRKVFHDDGKLRSPSELDDDTAYGIASIEVDVESHIDRDGVMINSIKTIRVKRHDPIHALNALARYFEMVPGQRPRALGWAGGSPGAGDDEPGTPTMKITIEGGFTDAHRRQPPD